MHPSDKWPVSTGEPAALAATSFATTAATTALAAALAAARAATTLTRPLVKKGPTDRMEPKLTGCVRDRAQCTAALRTTKGQEVGAELADKVVACFASYQQQAKAHYEEVVVKALLEKKAGPAALALSPSLSLTIEH